jgi:ribosomal protein L23
MKLLAGTKHYFPNFTFKLLRSNLPPHQQVFHCPSYLNKLDITQFLTKVYGLNVLDVRTANYLAKEKKVFRGRKQNNIPAFKRAIVTLDEDFIFPPPPQIGTDCIRIPPQISFGRNSGNSKRYLINLQAKERGVDLDRSFSQ